VTAPSAAETAVVPAPKAAPVAFGARGVQLTSLEDAYRFAKYVAASGLAPKSFHTPEQVLVAVQWGAEVGFSPMQALQGIPVINGRPSIMVEPAMALAMASGLLVQRHDRFEGEGLTRTAIVALVRKGGMAIERRFSVADAKQAGLEKKDIWKSYPDRMLYARALGYCLKDLFPDVLRGMPVAETLDDFGQVPEPAERNITPRRPAQVGPDPLLAALEAGPISQAIELELQAEREPVPVEETDDDSRVE
jgi:hypothetical protein